MSYSERDERFDNLMDEIYGDFTLGELTFSASDVLYNCDPIAYRVYKSDWMSEEEEADSIDDCIFGCGDEGGCRGQGCYSSEEEAYS